MKDIKLILSSQTNVKPYKAKGPRNNFEKAYFDELAQITEAFVNIDTKLQTYVSLTQQFKG